MAAARLRPMDVLINVFVALHIIGIASLLGGFLTQMKAMGAGHGPLRPGDAARRAHHARHGCRPGRAQPGRRPEREQHQDRHQAAVLIVILALVYVKRDEEKVDKGAFAAVGGLTVANIFIATLWT